MKAGSSLTEAREELRQRGYRVTPQRQLILEAVLASEDHISAEEIHSQVKARFPGVNISTVYRTLDLLKELGMVTETDLGGKVRCHYVDKGRHHHLLCRKCGEMIELDDSFLTPLEEAIAKKYRFQADLRHFAISGLCSVCR